MTLSMYTQHIQATMTKNFTQPSIEVLNIQQQQMHINPKHLLKAWKRLKYKHLYMKQNYCISHFCKEKNVFHDVTTRYSNVIGQLQKYNKTCCLHLSQTAGPCFCFCFFFLSGFGHNQMCYTSAFI